MDKISTIDEKIIELKSLGETLSLLAENCQGNDRPNCPIIDDLAGVVKQD